MSYCLVRKCGTCKKKVQCMDSSFVQAAIAGIHSANYTDAQRQVHLGAGSITIDCCNYQNEVIGLDTSENPTCEMNK